MTKNIIKPLDYTVTVLNKLGLSASHEIQALITLIAMHSATLGDSIAVGITSDDNAEATEFLNICRKISSTAVAYGGLTRSTFFNNTKAFTGASVVEYDSSMLNKIIDEIFAIMDDSFQYEQKRSRRYKELRRSATKGPVSLVFIARDQLDPLLSRPEVIHIHLPFDQASVLQRKHEEAVTGEVLNEDQFKEEIDKARHLFLRSQTCQVSIPYIDKILGYIDFDKPNMFGVLNNIVSLLKNITRINYSINFSDEYRNKPNQAEYYVRKNQGITLTPTYNDYCDFFRISKDLFPVGNNLLFGRELEVYNAIKKINLSYLQETLCMDLSRASEDVILETIHNNIEAWATMEEVVCTFNAERDQPLSAASINRELQKILHNKKNQGIIDRIKKPGVKNGFVYAINMMSQVSWVQLPHPDEIPFDEKESMEDMNLSKIVGDTTT